MLEAVKPIEDLCRYCNRDSNFSVLETSTRQDEGQFYGVEVAICRCNLCKSALTLFQRTMFDERDVSRWKRIYPPERRRRERNKRQRISTAVTL